MGMPDVTPHKKELAENGFSILNDLFDADTIETIIATIDATDKSNPNFRKSEGLFAIRQFFKEVPGVIPHIFTERFKSLIARQLGSDFFVVKSIYFDKPEDSNWFVAYHQDLTISVTARANIPGFGPWTVKQNQYSVQPPIQYLENIVTIRIHLDDTDETNGALKVIPGSHLKGIYRPESIDWNHATAWGCSVAKGGIMLMKPLLLHASSRSVGKLQRRVIHIECCNKSLPEGLQWAEQMEIF